MGYSPETISVALDGFQAGVRSTWSLTSLQAKSIEGAVATIRQR